MVRNFVFIHRTRWTNSFHRQEELEYLQGSCRFQVRTKRRDGSQRASLLQSRSVPTITARQTVLHRGPCSDHAPIERKVAL